MDVFMAERFNKNAEIQRLWMVVQAKKQQGARTDWEEWKIVQLKASVHHMDKLLIEWGSGQWMAKIWNNLQAPPQPQPQPQPEVRSLSVISGKEKEIWMGKRSGTKWQGSGDGENNSENRRAVDSGKRPQRADKKPPSPYPSNPLPDGNPQREKGKDQGGKRVCGWCKGHGGMAMAVNVLEMTVIKCFVMEKGTRQGGWWLS